MVLLYKKQDMSREDFRHYWRTTHKDIALRIPGIKKYIQCHVPMDGQAFDGVAELWFDDMAALGAGMASPAGLEAAKDVQNFCEKQQPIVVEEEQYL